MRPTLDPERFEAFGSYLLLRPLGKGGMGVVYAARTSNAAHPLAALKRLRPDAARLPGFAERFWHEGALALRLSHPNVVEALDAGEIDGTPYMASELVVGRSVHAISEQLERDRLGAPAAVAVRVLLDVLDGLAYVHSASEPGGRTLRLVHRDITPGNLLIGYDGTTRIADFGLAKSALTEHLQLTAEGMILGTPRYLAPEMIAGQPSGPAADIYGLGAVAYKLLTGLAPYDGTPREIMEKALRERPRPLAALRPDLPRWLTETVDRMMEHDLAKRPASAPELANDLETVARARNHLIGSAELGRWLIDLFPEEHRRDQHEIEEMLRVAPARDQRAEGTRVLQKQSRLVGATLAGRPEQDATVIGGDLVAPEDTDRRPSPVPLEFLTAEPPTGKIANPLLSPPPAPAPIPPTPRRAWTLLLAGMLLSGVLGAVFQRLLDDDGWPVEVVQQLGEQRQKLEDLRASGRPVGPEADRLVEAVKAAAIDERRMPAELALQELTMMLRRAERSSTGTVSAGALP